MRIERDGESIQGIREKIAEDRGGFLALGLKQVNCPDWIMWSVAELDEEHFASHELVLLAASYFRLITTCVFRPLVDIALKLAWHFDVRCVARSQNSFNCHRETIALQHLAVFGKAFYLKVRYRAHNRKVDDDSSFVTRE